MAEQHPTERPTPHRSDELDAEVRRIFPTLTDTIVDLLNRNYPAPKPVKQGEI
jgi:hypothetical protein